MAEATQDHKDAQKAANVEDWQEKYDALTVTVNGATYQADSESISQMTKILLSRYCPMDFIG